MAEEIEEKKGLGLCGLINGVEARLGSWDLVSEPNEIAPVDSSLWFWMAGQSPTPIRLTEAVKDGGLELVSFLKQHGISVEILSGDSPDRVSSYISGLVVALLISRVPHRKFAEDPLVSSRCS